MKSNGIEIEPIVWAAVRRAGYGPHLIEPVASTVALFLLARRNVTPELIGAIADELIPGIADAAADEALARMPPISTAVN
jgi:hypothetical protein